MSSSSSEENPAPRLHQVAPTANTKAGRDSTVWHRKSKQGCRTCKIRKVKCDESRPLCRNCARRFPGIERCDFAPPLVGSGTTGQITIPQGVACRPNHVHESNRLRVLELRLMHHYTGSVQIQLPDHGIREARQMWELDIPQTAFGNEIVLSALLALSALHFRMVSPRDAEMNYAAGHYFAQAVRSYRPALAQITAANAESLLITAMLIAYYTWLVSYRPTPGVPYTLPLQSFYLIRGVFDLLFSMSQHIKSPSLQWLFESIPLVDPTVIPSNRFLAIYQQDTERFMKSFEENTTQEDKAVYLAGINYMSSVCNSIASGTPHQHIRRLIATMVPNLPTQFLDMVGKKDPRAMAIMARNIAIIKLTDRVWWLHGAEGDEAEEYHVRGIFELMPVEWLWTMDWPLRVASGRLGLSDEETPLTLMTPDSQLAVRVQEGRTPQRP